MEIALTDLEDYVNGKLRFEWVDLEDIYDIDDLEETIKKFMDVTGHEEYFITDYDEFPDLGEYPELEDIITVKECIESVQDEPAWEIVQAFLDWGNGIDQLDSFEDSYRGLWDSFEDYAYEFAESVGDFASVPESMRYYIDWEAYSRDLECNGFYTDDIGYQVAVFECI